MLVLSREKNERIVINDNIVVTVVDIRGDKVRLGFDAPKEVPIHRREFNYSTDAELEVYVCDLVPTLAAAEALVVYGD